MGLNFCPGCGSKAVAGAKFCPECGGKFPAVEEGPGARSPDAAKDTAIPSGDLQPASAAEGRAVHRSEVAAGGDLHDSVISRSSVRAGGDIEGSVVSRSDVRTDHAGIKDAVISHSTIVQTETHQHFGESVGTYETQMELGRTAYEGKNWEEAVEFFNSALKMNSRSYEPWFLKGMSAAELRRTDEAITNLRRALKLDGKQTDRILERVKELVDRIFKSAQMQEAQAGELLGRARTGMQHSYDYKAGIHNERSGGMAKSLALDLFVMPGLGSSMRTTKAVEGLEKKQEADKLEAEARKLEEQAKERFSEAAKLYNFAVRYCDLVIEFRKEDEFSWMRRGEIFLRQRLYDDACRSFEAVVGFKPDHQEALSLRGTCYTAQGKAIPPLPGSSAGGAAKRTEEPEATPKKEAPGPPAAAHQAPPPSGQPMIPHSALPYQPPVAARPQPAMMPPVTAGRAPQMAPQPQSALRGAAPPAAPAPLPPPALRQPVPPPAPVTPAARPAPAPPPASRAPAPGGPGPAPGSPKAAGGSPGGEAPRSPAAKAAPLNPCPYCRCEMSFVRERGVWLCGSCRRFSGRPAR